MISYHRGALAARLACRNSSLNGAMMSVALCESDAQRYLDEMKLSNGDHDVTVACINSPSNVTLTGPEAQLNMLQSRLETESVFNRKLQVNVTYHSAQMNEVALEYLMMIKDIESGKAFSETPVMISSLTGDVVKL